MDSNQRLDVQISWLIRRDMKQVMHIERESYEYPWDEDDFWTVLRQRNCIGMTAENESGLIVGFMVYRLHKARLDVLNMAVDPEFRRLDVGSQMVERLIDKLSQQRRKEIDIEVRERNLAAQLFFKFHGFRCVRVLRDHYEVTTEDCYHMRYSIRDDVEAEIRNAKNRLSEFIS